MDFVSSMAPPSDVLFPDSFRAGVNLWQARVSQLQGSVVQKNYSYPIGDEDGEELITQSVVIGDPNATNFVVIISATHGVEGFAGTAVQCDLLHLLNTGHITPCSDTAILLINALNPWGFHFLHRHDHLGVDVNRNFIDFGKPLPDNSGYSQLQSLLAITDPADREQALTKFKYQIGQRNYEIAASGGQYVDNCGPFYGGNAESHSRRVIESLIERYQLASKRLAVIDIHTGLGPYGYGEVICDHPGNSAGSDVAQQWYGPSCTSAEAGTSSSVPKSGLLDYAWHEIMDTKSCFITLEFGTLGTESLFRVLQADRYSPDQPTAFGNSEMCNHFNPQDNYWREAVLFRGRQVILQALAGVTR